MHLTCRAPGYGEILTGEMHQPAINTGAACDHSIGRQIFICHAKVSGTMLGECSNFLKTVSIDKLVHALAGSEFSRSAVLVDSFFSSSAGDGATLHAKLGDLSFHRWFLRNKLQCGCGYRIRGHSRTP